MLSLTLHGLVAFAGIVMAFVGYPLWRGHIPPNGTYGFRTPETLKNPELWYQVNQQTGFELLVLGLVVAVSCAISYYLWGQSKPNASVLANVVILVVGTIAVAIHGFSLLKT